MSISIGPGITVGGGINLGGYGPWPPGPNSSLQFSNGNGYVSITDSNRMSVTPGNSWTFEGFFYFSSFGASDSYFGKWNNISNEYIFWPVTPGSTIGFRTYLSDGQTPQVDLAFPIPSTNAWHHIAFCKSAFTFYIYVDGVVVAQSAISGTTNYNSGTPFQLGAGGNFKVSNFRFALSAVYPYGVTFTPPTGPLPATQSASYPIGGIASNQIELLLNTYTATPLLDGSGYYGNVPVTGTITYSTNAPF
jgi:hypothetical protein